LFRAQKAKEATKFMAGTSDATVSIPGYGRGCGALLKKILATPKHPVMVSLSLT